MTKKQNQILEAALNLFSEEGYNATSTSKVAKEASVSEGLIFRHFKNKEGLLETILKEVNEKVNLLLIPVENEEESKQIIYKALEIPFSITESDLKYWKLLFKLRWELEHQTVKTFDSIRKPLTKAFEKLRYRNPKLETEFLMQHLNGLMGSIIKNKITNKEETKDFLLRKYHL